MIRVGNAQAFWGDRPRAAYELLEQCPNLDFLTMDYLAEVSMSILATQRERNPELGYPKDFVDVVGGLASYWAAGGKCRLIANAGGLNPRGCAEACVAALEAAGCRSMKIAVVSGDDVIDLVQHAAANPIEKESLLLSNLDSGKPISTIREKLVTANAYLGCKGIVAALRAGADIIITGRVADPSMVVAPCVYAFQWELDDWDRLAGATVAGHLLECGTHVTGGISTDWLDVPDATHIGFPIAEISPDGSCVITKSETSGGCVTLDTVKEQLVYEIGDPKNYLSPDVTVCFLELQLKSDGPNRIHVSGAVGSPSPETLKVSATYRDGYRAAGMLTFFGPRSQEKAQRCGNIILARLAEAGHAYRDTLVECLGNAASVPLENLMVQTHDRFEIVLRMAVESDSRESVEAFSREFMSLVTSGPQGTTGYAEGRPRVHSVFRYWPCLISNDKANMVVDSILSSDTLSSRTQIARWPEHSDSTAARPCQWEINPIHVSEVRHATCLSDIAFGRSGDKGTGANIGILARTPEAYQFLCEWLSEARVLQVFSPLGVEAVQRFELPNLQGFNFIVRGILRRGLRNDAQGKALAQALLSIPLTTANM